MILGFLFSASKQQFYWTMALYSLLLPIQSIKRFKETPFGAISSILIPISEIWKKRCVCDHPFCPVAATPHHKRWQRGKTPEGFKFTSVRHTGNFISVRPFTENLFNFCWTFSCPICRTDSRSVTGSEGDESSNFIMTIDFPSEKGPDHWVGRGVATIAQS